MKKSEVPDFDWICENKFGIKEHLYDQCPDRCTCKEDECKSDYLFFYWNGLYQAYKANMLKAGK